MSVKTGDSITDLIMEIVDSRRRLKMDKLVKSLWDYYGDGSEKSREDIENAVRALREKGLLEWNEQSGYVSIPQKQTRTPSLSPTVIARPKTWMWGHYSPIDSRILYDGTGMEHFLVGSLEKHYVENTKECIIIWTYDNVVCDSMWGNEDFRIYCHFSGDWPKTFFDYVAAQSSYESERLLELPQTSCAYLLFNEMRKRLEQMYPDIAIFLDEFMVVEGR